ncbi:MAG: DUF3558 family protein [Bacteroidota bacterium]
MKKLSFYLPFFASLLLLSACSSSSEQKERPSENLEQSNTEARDDWDLSTVKGLDFSNFDPCGTIPAEAIAAVVGELRSEATKRITELAEEKGCQWVNTKGNFFEIIYYPLSEWELADVTTYQAEKIEGIGDGAYLGKYSDAHFIKVLVKDKAMIGVRASNKDLDMAKALFNTVALKYLPKK